MSDSTGLIVISFVGMLGFFLSLYIADKANTLGVQIATGLVQGSPVSLGVRTAMLYQVWLTYEVLGAASNVFLLIALLELAAQVDASGIKFLANFAAFIAGLGSALWLVSGSAGLFQYRAFLRRARQR